MKEQGKDIVYEHVNKEQIMKEQSMSAMNSFSLCPVPLFSNQSPPQLILVVEDDDEFASLLLHMINTASAFKAILASNAMEALNIIQHLKCDLFLLEDDLPDMDGVELYDRLHTTSGYEQTPAILLSANPHLRQQELEKRQITVFPKLLDLPQLLQIVHARLASGES